MIQKHFSSVNFGFRLHQGLPEAPNSKISWGACPHPLEGFGPWPDHFKIADTTPVDIFSYVHYYITDII